MSPIFMETIGSNLAEVSQGDVADDLINLLDIVLSRCETQGTTEKSFNYEIDKDCEQVDEDDTMLREECVLNLEGSVVMGDNEVGEDNSSDVEATDGSEDEMSSSNVPSNILGDCFVKLNRLHIKDISIRSCYVHLARLSGSYINIKENRLRKFVQETRNLKVDVSCRLCSFSSSQKMDLLIHASVVDYEQVNEDCVLQLEDYVVLDDNKITNDSNSVAEDADCTEDETTVSSPRVSSKIYRDCFVRLNRLHIKNVSIRSCSVHLVRLPRNYFNFKQNCLPNYVQKTRNFKLDNFSCKLCKFSTSQKLDLLIHVKNKHGDENILSCNKCKYRTTDITYLKAHENCKHNDSQFKCTSCKFTCASRNGLTYHIKTVHQGSNGFDCNTCEFKTLLEFKLKIHMVTVHNKEKFFKCSDCLFKTISKNSIIRHIKFFHNDNNTYVCNIVCGFKTIGRSNLEKHLRTHSGEKPYACSICGYKTAYSYSLKLHMKIHTKKSNNLSVTQNEQLLVCNKCSFKTTHKVSLNNHMKIHDEEKPFACHLCKFRTKHKSCLAVHMDRKHSKKKHLSCDKCEYKTTCKQNLRTHVQTHNVEKSFSCDLCEFSTLYKATLNYHIKSHTKEKPFACNLCEFKTTYNRSLKYHQEGVHNKGEKQFTCNICDYKSYYRRGLKSHMMVHTGEKPHNCNVCGYKTAYKGRLREHLRMHSGEKPFSCDECDYRAIRRYYVKIHKLKVHFS